MTCPRRSPTMTDPFRMSPPTRVGMTRLQRQLAVDHNEESKEYRHGTRSTKHHPEQRRRDARPRPRRLPDPAGRDPRRGRGRARRPATATSTPPPRTATSARSARPSRASGVDRAEVFLETKIWISDYGYDETLHGFEKSAGKLGVDQIDLLILHQALPSAFDKTLEAYRALETLLADGKVRAIGVSNFMVDHLTALLDAGRGRARGQPDRGAPLLPAARGPGLRRRARHPHAGLVADRRHHLLPRRRAHQHPRGPGHRRDRRGARQDPGAGDAALAPAAGPLGHPEVDQARTASPRTSTSSTSSSPPTSWPRSTPSTPASAAAPSPTTSPSRASAARSPKPDHD